MQKQSFISLKKIVFFFLCFSLSLFSEEFSLQKKRTANKILLHLAPSLEGTILCKLPAGKLLTILPFDNLSWAKVLLPEDVFLWTTLSHIQKGNGFSLAPDAPLRTGPGAFYPLAGRSKGGEKVMLFEKSPSSYWQKIRLTKPFLICYCQYKDLADIKKSTAKKGKKRIEKSKFFMEKSSMEGFLCPLEDKEKELGDKIRYFLAVTVGKKRYARAFLKGEEVLLSRWKNRHVKVTGKKYWKEGFSRPVFLVEKIEPDWNQ